MANNHDIQSWLNGDVLRSKAIREQYPLIGLIVALVFVYILMGDAEVKQARRKKLLEYHPDRIQGKGLPDSFIAFAAEQTRKINEAYELIASRRGMKNR